MESRKQDILALAVLVTTLLVFFSLVSFHPSDDTLFHPWWSGNAPRNWVGSFGANFAWGLLNSLGLGSYVLVAAGLTTAWILFCHRWPLEGYWLHMGGLGLVTLSLVSLVSLHIPQISIHGADLPTGGNVGLFVARMLVLYLYPIGAHILLTGFLLTGLVLVLPCTLQALISRLIRLGWMGLRCSGRCAFLLSSRLRLRTQDAEPSQAVMVSRSRRKQTDAALEVLPVNGTQVLSKDLEKTPLPPPDFAQTPRGSYTLPSLALLDTYAQDQVKPDGKKLEENARVLEEKLADFGVQGRVTAISPGPVITMYEYAPAPGIKISRIVGLSDDLAMALKAASIRVVAPIPGKAAIGIELPNPKREMVSMMGVLSSEVFSSSPAPLTVALGQDITGQPVSANLAKMPHLLIAGATGTGKSVGINALLSSLLFRNTPEDLRLLLIDPKRIELSMYEGIPHLIHPVVTDAKLATRALKWAVEEMELRYKLLADKGSRSIEGYNRILAKEPACQNSGEVEGGEENSLPHHRLPFIVIVIDELADLMMVASREVEEFITRLAQMARAAGIHLILATQRPSVDVLTGIIKANIPTRISFQVSSRIDSRTILDTQGAESLLGNGDMLFLPPGTAKLQRIHGAFVSDNEVQRLTEFWRRQSMGEDPLSVRVRFEDNGSAEEISQEVMDERYQDAVDIVMETRQASISMLQRRLRVGYNRAARMIELMEQQGIVSPSDGVKPREVLGRRP